MDLQESDSPTDRAPRARRGERSRWALALLLAGFSAGLFSIVIYQMFNFFGVSWLLFANLLFMGFPLGGYLYLRYLDQKPDAFARSLTHLLAAMLLSVAIFFLLKYPTAWWTTSIWSANAVAGLLKLSLATALPFLPFFVAYGVMEVAGYRAGQRIFAARSNLVYALYLFGLGLGYAFFSATIEGLGVLRMALVALIAWGAARAPIRGPGRGLAAGAVLFGSAFLLAPGLGDLFVRAIHPHKIISSRGDIEIGGEFQVVLDRWDRASPARLPDRIRPVPRRQCAARSSRRHRIPLPGSGHRPLSRYASLPHR